MGGERWTPAEQKEFQRYFNGNMMPLTLFLHIQEINPARTYQAVDRELRRWARRGFTKPRDRANRSLRIGYFDIETTGLKADMDYILCWYIKRRGKHEYQWAAITRAEILDETFDRRVVEELIEAMNLYDILYVHWGSDWRFDIPFFRTRAVYHGLGDKLPKNGQLFIRDTHRIAKPKLRLRSYRLNVLAEALGIRNVKKTPLEPLVWLSARSGNEKALERILLHNKRDVQLLERVQRGMEKAGLEQPIFRSI